MDEPRTWGAGCRRRASTQRRHATRSCSVVALLFALFASACAPNAIKSADIPKVLAARAQAAMQERLVVLGVHGCPNSQQLGVLITPDTVATPLRIPEVEGTITATNLLGETVPVGSPISYPQLTLSPGSEIVHYALADTFDGGPRDSTVPPRSSGKTEPFTATIAWVEKGTISTATARVTWSLNVPIVHVDRAKIGLTDFQPAAVINPALGVIGWLSGRFNRSDTSLPVLPLKGPEAGGPPPAVADSACPAAQLSRLAKTPMLGRVNPYAASAPDQPKSELPTAPPTT